MIESCNLFLFILIDFDKSNGIGEKSDNDIVMSEFISNIKHYESLGVPKTFIIGVSSNNSSSIAATSSHCLLHAAHRRTRAERIRWKEYG